MTNTDTADAAGDGRARWPSWPRPARRSCASRSTTAPRRRGWPRSATGCATSTAWTVPLVGDFHYNGHTLLREFPDCAEALAKYRINPGNVGRGARHDANFATMVQAAIDHGRPVRIGVNARLARPRAARRADGRERAPRRALERRRGAARGDGPERAHLRGGGRGARPAGGPRSCCRARPAACRTWWPSTATWPRAAPTRCTWGSPRPAWAARASSRPPPPSAILLQDGVGDTIRASLTPEPGGDRALEVRVCRELLQSLGLRAFRPEVTACPGCGRTTSTVFQELAQTIERHLDARMAEWRTERPGVAELKVAVMGCIVNGPGESRAADIGISLPGTGEQPRAPVYVDGEKVAHPGGADPRRGLHRAWSRSTSRRATRGPGRPPPPLSRPGRPARRGGPRGRRARRRPGAAGSAP